MIDSLTILLIDDDPLNNMLSKTTLRFAAKNPVFYVFEDANDGLEFITTNVSVMDKSETIVLLLDINLPSLTGWEFLDKLEEFNTKVINNIHIFMLSSSIMETDRQKAMDNPYVIDYLEKPLSLESARHVYETVSRKKGQYINLH